MTARVLTLLFLLLKLPLSTAGEILVVAGHKTAVNEINIKQLKNIFLRKTLVNEFGNQWVPVNLAPDNRLRRAFSEIVFKQRPDEMELYWNVQYFQGVTPPHVVGSEEAMLLFIADTPGAIGYIRPCYLDVRVRVVLRLKLPDELTQNCIDSEK